MAPIILLTPQRDSRPLRRLSRSSFFLSQFLKVSSSFPTIITNILLYSLSSVSRIAPCGSDHFLHFAVRLPFSLAISSCLAVTNICFYSPASRGALDCLNRLSEIDFIYDFTYSSISRNGDRGVPKIFPNLRRHCRDYRPASFFSFVVISFRIIANISLHVSLSVLHHSDNFYFTVSFSLFVPTLFPVTAGLFHYKSRLFWGFRVFSSIALRCHQAPCSTGSSGSIWGSGVS
jgi:hypothetical protein